MDVIKRKILLSELNGNIHFKIPLYQKIDDLGIVSDTIDGGIINKENGGLPLHFMVDGITSNWYKEGGGVTYASDSKLNLVKSYSEENPYIKHFNVNKSKYYNFKDKLINGVNRVTNINGDEITYVIDANWDPLIGSSKQVTGIKYTDNPEEGLDLPEDLVNGETTTKVEYKAEGWNNLNTSITPQIKEEYLLGIINEPEVKNDVFIDRSSFSVLDLHLRLSEVESLEHLTNYGNGFYKINRD